MGAESAAGVIFHHQIAASEDPQDTRTQAIAEYRSELMHPYYAAECGLVDDVINPRCDAASGGRRLGHACGQALRGSLPQARQPAAVTGESQIRAMNPEAEQLAIQVVWGHPSDVDIAAVIAVLLLRAGSRATPEDRPARVRRPISHQPPYCSPLSWRTAT
jgi:hypothetical protein